MTLNEIMRKASMEEQRFEMYCNETNGYVRKTTFCGDFTIAEGFGVNAITDTYKNAIKSFPNDKIYLTELVMVLNYKCWGWYSKGNENLSKLYADLYYKGRDYAYSHLDEEGCSYLFNNID